MKSILDERSLTADERRAASDEPRPGVWLEGANGPARKGDGRVLTQHETDQLIAHELLGSFEFGTAPYLEARRILGDCVAPILEGNKHPNGQRGGIHSDQLVRLLAFRVFGARDRMWRKRETARTLENIRSGDRFEAWRIGYGFDGLIVTGQLPGLVMCEANRDSAYAKVEATRAPSNPERIRADYFDIFDQLDAKLSGGGDPPTGQLTIDIDMRR